MPRQKKQRLKKRADGYYVCRYKDQWFYSMDHDDALAQREEYKRLEKQALLSVPTVAEFAEKWIDRAYPSASASTMDGLKIHLKKLTDAIGGKLLTDVKPSDIKQIYSDRYPGLSNSYIRSAAQLYRALFDAAVADRYTPLNPARDKTASPHRGSTGSHRQITPQEREWICTLCTDHRAHPAVMAMLYAGIRPQEMKAVKIDRDVDFAADVIRLHESAHLQDSNHYKMTKEGKTDLAMREIPLFPPLKEALSGRKGYLISSAKGNHVEIKTCARWMGHKDAKMILRIYDEASDDRSQKEAERLRKTLFRSGNGSGE